MRLDSATRRTLIPVPDASRNGKIKSVLVQDPKAREKPVRSFAFRPRPRPRRLTGLTRDEERDPISQKLAAQLANPSLSTLTPMFLIGEPESELELIIWV